MKTKFSSVVGKSRVFYCICDVCGESFKRKVSARNYFYCRACANKLAGFKRRKRMGIVLNDRLHITWANMKRRCVNPTEKEKANYTLKGITLCDEWFDYQNFQEWDLSNGYKDNLTIDRIDNSKGYYPANCRFTNYSTQNANRTQNVTSMTGYIGVTKNTTKFRSYIDFNGNRIELGKFVSAKEAAKARDDYIIKNKLPHRLNFE